jgi:hypothetical protein
LRSARNFVKGPRNESDLVTSELVMDMNAITKRNKSQVTIFVELVMENPCLEVIYL